MSACVSQCVCVKPDGSPLIPLNLSYNCKGSLLLWGLFFAFLSPSLLSTLFSQIVSALNFLTTEHWDLLEDFVWFFPCSHSFEALKLTFSLVIIWAGLLYVSQKLTHRYLCDRQINFLCVQRCTHYVDLVATHSLFTFRHATATNVCVLLGFL